MSEGLSAFDAAAAGAAGTMRLCGVDEAGRGPLAGPVVVAAVVLPAGVAIDGIADSKTLDERDRAEIARRLFAEATVAVVSAGPARIDRLNIRGATLWAMRRAVASLSEPPRLALFDGRDVPEGLAVPARAVVGGDGQSAAIAAASIVAKVTRDRLMERLGRAFPLYGFERHKGYATPEHRAALAAHGATVHHRRSFEPVRQALAARPAATDPQPQAPSAGASAAPA